MKVYIVGGYIPKGGTYMAYHIGRILHQRFGCECLVVRVGDELVTNGIFEYAKAFDTIPMDRLGSAMSKSDILVVNPSFSHAMLGLKLPGKKLMYAQGFNTFQVIDGFIDRYVSVSSCVQQYLKLVYDIQTPVIPAFVRHDLIPPSVPWLDRPANSVFAIGKFHFTEFLQAYLNTLRERHPDLRPGITTSTGSSHAALLDKMSRSRYVLSLSPTEGFGLQPLEAMACGCTVVGFTGCGGRDFMRSGENCESVEYPDFKGLADRLARVIGNADHAQQIATRAAKDAQAYDLPAFEQRWVDYLTQSGLV